MKIKLEITIESEQELSELYNRFCRVEEFFPAKNKFEEKGIGLGVETSEGMDKMAGEMQQIVENYLA